MLVSRFLYEVVCGEKESGELCLCVNRPNDGGLRGQPEDVDYLGDILLVRTVLNGLDGQ